MMDQQAEQSPPFQNKADRKILRASTSMRNSLELQQDNKAGQGPILQQNQLSTHKILVMLKQANEKQIRLRKHYKDVIQTIMRELRSKQIIIDDSSSFITRKKHLKALAQLDTLKDAIIEEKEEAIQAQLSELQLKDREIEALKAELSQQKRKSQKQLSTSQNQSLKGSGKRKIEAKQKADMEKVIERLLLDKSDIQNKAKLVEETLANQIIALKASLHNQHQRYETMYIQCHETIQIIKDSKQRVELQSSREVDRLKVIILSLKEELEKEKEENEKRQERYKSINEAADENQLVMIRRDLEQAMKNKSILEGYIQKKGNLIDELVEQNEGKSAKIQELTKQFKKLQDEVHRGRAAMVQMKIQIQELEAEKIGLEQQLRKEREKMDVIEIPSRKNSEKQKEYISLSQEIGRVRATTIVVGQPFGYAKNSSHSSDSESLSDAGQDASNIDLYEQLEDEKQKNQILEKKYEQLKKSYDKMIEQAVNAVKESISQKNKSDEEDEPDNSRFSQRSFGKKEYERYESKEKSERKSLPIQFFNNYSGELQRMPSENSFMSSNNILKTFFDPNEMTDKIQGFSFQNSIINRIYGTKFINRLQDKVSFIFLYACLLETYFSSPFLSIIREQLFMSEQICLKPITPAEMNESLFFVPQPESVSILTDSRANSSHRLSLSNQYSYNSFQPRHQQKSEEMGVKNILQEFRREEEEVEKGMAELKKIKKELFEVTEALSARFLTVKELQKNPIILKQLEELKKNSIAQMIQLLVKENEVVKKCLNQMIQNEEIYSNLNNEVYFEEKHREGCDTSMNTSFASSISGSQGLKGMHEGRKRGENNENCRLM